MNLLLGNCLEILPTLDADSVDAVVTDPPYSLGFMGKAWDRNSIASDPRFWLELLRTMKPGAHLLAFGGTRTYHRMVCAIEDAGFEIRDCLMWVYGSGFPKSLDVSKALDKEAGRKRKVVGMSARKSGIADANAGPQSRETDFSWATGKSVAAHYPITEPATDDALQWSGWGTALKPAWEPIILARKPLSEKTVAANVKRWGTGAINVDGCRVGTDSTTRHSNGGTGDLEHWRTGKRECDTGSPSGRWPANLLHDGSEEVLAGFPNTGESKGGYRGAGARQNGYGMKADDDKTPIGFGDTGSAARFFYCAKASRRERNLGCEELPEQVSRRDDGQPYGMNTNTHRPDGSKRNPVKPRGNHHPTVKPLALMTYLCRLITQPGGTILDPFMGSGTTGLAAQNEGFDFIGIEREPEYMAIAEKRIAESDTLFFGQTQTP